MRRGRRCYEKKRYGTEDAARRALLSTMIAKGLRRNHHRRERRVYQCPVCNGWHLTAQEKRR